MPEQEFPESLEDIQSRKLNEAIRAAKTVTVEFGTGDSPLFEAQNGGNFDEESLYVGVNLESKQHKYLADRVERIRGFAVLADRNSATGAPVLPIPASIADLVFMGNVFGEPDSPHAMHPFKQADRRYYGHSSIDAKTATLRQAASLLKEDGRLVILENITPFGVGYGQESYRTIAKLLEGNGYRVVQVLTQRSDGWEEIVSRFATPHERWSRHSYMVIAEKE